MKVLAIIPARGGSKGIPRKNVRLMNGKPLIYYAIHNAQLCSLITDVAVSSDDEEILGIAATYGAEALQRPAYLAEDSVTLDPVICDAVLQMEKMRNQHYDIVITLQPTSPVLRAQTLEKALQAFIEDAADTYISAVNKPHLSWSKSDKGYYPLYKERLNRQQLPPNYLEAGAFFITRREFITENSRMGSQISVYEIPEQEAVDIDTANDWIVCEAILGRKKIVLRADGHQTLGMGHIYHCLTLAYNLIGHEVMFVTKARYREGIEKLQESFMPIMIVENDEEFFRFLEKYCPDVVVNDCLDTSEEYMKKLKKICPRVVTIEDMGEGARYADVVINALYADEKVAVWKNVYCGEDYICLRDEFLVAEPKPLSQEVREVVVLFGGTDPSNLTEKAYRLAKKIHPQYPHMHFTFIVGIGYDSKAHGVISCEGCNITVIQNAKFVSAYMKRADLALTSQGRTVYELAALGIPAVVMAQNEREQLHIFAQMQNGFFNLGLGSHLEDETLERTFEFLVNTPQLRDEMRQLMLSHRQRLKNGVKNEIRLILDER
ncbi:UDP-2,4-diacetamido-2,4,6-trideoxy-beta-L-altropyranose hydrolase [Acetanaerobacterium sp. MSJ-12]|uniref:cytidylyltransferase domain-containing protein n=1 Tax=Oscillospiraceae TaxID=216572 RepID=UPI001C0EF1BA|nr:UDP-2,4-diacetamido-2,4,6-trideoxy-beta-L-altropyranose hydrolase [Acetanaerobacterium sp. MSJ-12]MBU5418771.1 UDP-2,4-diacetamido-2,4,6-trideoxy-beta-L-altropyranose hydrolase [Acetanaerobacterium sp. MSJ-12]